MPIRTDSTYKPLHSFALDKQRSYKQQYGDMYFLRLAKIKPAVEEVASKAWDGTEIGGELAKRVDRVLDVRQGELCWVAGTVYMDMRLKPNILEDVSKDVSHLQLFICALICPYLWYMVILTTIGSSADSVGYPLPSPRKSTTPTTAPTRSCSKTTRAAFA